MNMLYDLRIESQQLFKTNNRHTGVINEDKFTEWFTEVHRETIKGRELYDCGDFLKQVGV